MTDATDFDYCVFCETSVAPGTLTQHFKSTKNHFSADNESHLASPDTPRIRNPIADAQQQYPTANMPSHAQQPSPHVYPPSTLQPQTRVVTHCIPCGVDIYLPGGLRIHKMTGAHTNTCIQQGLYCIPCQQLFHTPNSKVAHAKRHNPAIAAHHCVDCGVSFTRKKSYIGHIQNRAARCKRIAAINGGQTANTPQHQPRPHPEIAPADPSSSSFSHGTERVLGHLLPGSPPVDPTWAQQTPAQIDTCIREGRYCFHCQKISDTPEMTAIHCKTSHDPDGPTDFRCSDCGVNFCSDALLGQHLRNHSSAPMQQVWLRYPSE